MFRSREKAKTFLFEFKKPTKIKIHSLFVFFPFVAVWLDKNNKIVKLKTVKPFSLAISPTRSYSKIIEIPINKKYSKIVQLLDGN